VRRARRLRLRKQNVPARWSKQEEDLLEKLYLHKNCCETAEQIGRSVSAITMRASQLGLRRTAPLWSKKELSLLRRLYPFRTAEQIAQEVGRPVRATRSKIFKLGLKKRKA